MKPQVILHMMTTMDGRIIADRWPNDFDIEGLYMDIHKELAGDAWLVGATTMKEIAVGTPNPVSTQECYSRTLWKAPNCIQSPYAVYLDRKGNVHLNIAETNGNPIVAVLVESVSDDYLAELRRDGISYLFAGKTEIDIPLALSYLERDFGVSRLLLQGGGVINGAFLDAGLIDEVYLSIMPFADGESGTPTLFERQKGMIEKFKLESFRPLNHDIVQIHYSAQK